MNIKGITLSQPYASLVAQASKRIETRGYSTPYRGLLAIHAAKMVPDWAREKMQLRAFRDALAPLGCASAEDLDALPRGDIVAIVRLADIFSVDDRDPRLPEFGTPVWEFGDYSRGRYAWVLEDLEPLAVPLPCSGALSIWDCEVDVEAGTARRITRAERRSVLQERSLL